MAKKTMQTGDVPLYSQRIRKYRTKKAWSQRQLAHEIDTDMETISRWETGKAKPSWEFQRKLMTVFGVSAEALGFVDEDEPISVETNDEIDEDALPASASINVPAEGATPKQGENTPLDASVNIPAEVSLPREQENQPMLSDLLFPQKGRWGRQKRRILFAIVLLAMTIGIASTIIWAFHGKASAGPGQTLTGVLTTASALSYTKPTSKPTHKKGTSTSTPGTSPTPTATTSTSGHGPVGSPATPTRVPTPTSAPAGTRSYTVDQDMLAYQCDGQPCPVELVTHVDSVRLLSPNEATIWLTFTNTSSSQDWNNVDYSRATLGSSSALDTPLFSVPAGQAQVEHLDFDGIDIHTGQQYKLYINLQVSGAFTYYFKITLTWCSNPCH